MKPDVPALAAWLRGAGSATCDLLLPPRCVACGSALGEAHRGLMLCGDCHVRLPLLDGPTCSRCAAPVPESNGVQLACRHCAEDRLWFERALVLGSYEGLLRQLVMRMKIDRNELVAHALVEATWRELSETLQGLAVDVVAAVPMWPWRRWQRGANGPAALARRLAAKLGVPAAPRMLRLKRNVPPQVGLSRPARFRNLAGEMALRSTYYLQNAHVLVVDDILTTGATCSEAARVLRRGGAAKASVFALARTPAEW